MVFKSCIAVSALVLMAAAPSQDGQVVRHPSDKYVAKDAPAPASNWAGQPWWAALAECAAVFSLAPEDKASFQKFAGYAMMRVADDRKVKAEEAAALVLPRSQGSTNQRAQIMVGGFGMAAVRANCDKLFVQYQAL